MMSYEQEKQAALARCAGLKVGDWVLHLHHKKLAEPLTEPVENRIAYILFSKAAEEIAIRLCAIRPLHWERVPSAIAIKLTAAQAQAKWVAAWAEWDAACAEWDAALEPYHALLCSPDCPWNGKSLF